MSMLIKNGTLITPEKIFRADILIKGEKIAKIGKIEKAKGEVLDATGLYILPGLIDAHVHLRDPGLTQKEDFHTGTRAALAGGFTTILDMPNTLPPTTTAHALAEKMKIAKEKAVCDYGFHFGATKDNLEEILRVSPPSLKLYTAASTGNLLIDSFPKQFEYFGSFMRERPLLVHAEDNALIEANKKKYKIHSQIRSSEAAQYGVRKAVLLAKYFNRKIHICHATTAEEIEIAKSYANATVEVTPHHLFLNTRDEKKLGNFGIVNPPLRKEKERAALWKSLSRADIIASDHAPHTKEEKKGPVAGVPGLETTLPLLLDAANKKMLTLQRIAELCARNPARIFGLRKKGELKEGFYADLTLVDLREKWKIKGENLETKCKWTPFERREVRGKVKKVILRGKLVFDEGVLAKKGCGKQIF